MKGWNFGPPPSIGWWPASTYFERTSIRWWNGKNWSMAAHPSCSAEGAAKFAYMPAFKDSQPILWTKRWWE